MNQEELQNKYTEAIVENLKNIALFKEFLYYDTLKEQNKKLQIENKKLKQIIKKLKVYLTKIKETSTPQEQIMAKYVLKYIKELEK